VARAEARLLKEAEAEKEAERRAKRAAKMAKFKGNTVEELTGAAAGAAIDRMMEEIPQMRFWCGMLSLTLFSFAGGETAWRYNSWRSQSSQRAGLVEHLNL
jgi:hypothetical protein